MQSDQAMRNRRAPRYTVARRRRSMRAQHAGTKHAQQTRDVESVAITATSLTPWLPWTDLRRLMTTSVASSSTRKGRILCTPAVRGGCLTHALSSACHQYTSCRRCCRAALGHLHGCRLIRTWGTRIACQRSPSTGRGMSAEPPTRSARGRLRACWQPARQPIERRGCKGRLGRRHEHGGRSGMGRIC